MHANLFVHLFFFKKKRYKSNSLVQLKWLIWRTALGTARNPMETKISFLQTIVISI